MLGRSFPLTEEKLFGWGYKKWALFFALQVFVLGAGAGFAITYSLATGKNPISYFSYGTPSQFNVLITANGTDTINSGGSRAIINGGSLFNLAPGCYHVEILLNYFAKQISVTSTPIERSLC